jgi:hypothetical protein
MKLRIDMDYDVYTKGEVVSVKPSVGHALLGMGVATLVNLHTPPEPHAQKPKPKTEDEEWEETGDKNGPADKGKNSRR